jgi:poly(A) polymerase
LWWPTVRLRNQLEDNGMAPQQAMQEASQTIINEELHHIAIPRRFTLPMREIWEFQSRLTHRSGKKSLSLLGHRRFRAAYDFLLLREASGEDLDGLGQFWTEMQEKHPNPPASDEEIVKDDRPPRRNRRRRRPRKQQE